MPLPTDLVNIPLVETRDALLQISRSSNLDGATLAFTNLGQETGTALCWAVERLEVRTDPSEIATRTIEVPYCNLVEVLGRKRAAQLVEAALA